jgi:hypothetical protein
LSILLLQGTNETTKEAANFTTRSIIIKHMYMHAAHGNIDPASKPGRSWVDGFIR